MKFENDKFEAVETGIMSRGGWGYTTEKSHWKWERTGRFGYIASIILIIMIFTVPILKGQDSSIYYKVEKKISFDNKRCFLTVSDTRFPSKYDFPLDDKDKILNYEDIIAPFAKISQIADSVFSVDELENLKKYHCCVNLIISSSGKIASVSYMFPNPDAKYSLPKLELFAQIIKKEIFIKIKFPRMVKKEGFVSYSIWLYKIIPYNQQKFTGFER